MLAGEQSRMMLYFVPQLGPAPRWCSFLEGLTEELEETAGQNVYEDYKFVTKTEVEELGASGLIGTPMLKGYMHGFFMEMKLYNKLRAVSKPFEYEEHRKKKIEGKIEEKRQSRIIAQKRLPKVNKDLAEKMIKLSTALKAKAGAGADGEKDTNGESAESIIDNRFASLFQREEFERDETSSEFKLRNPSKGHNQRKSGNDDSDDELQNLYAPVEEVDDEDSDEDDQGSDEDVGEGGGEGGSNNHDDDDSDIDQIRNEDDDVIEVKSRKRKGAKGDNSDEEGEIFRATKRAIERRKSSEAKAASRSTSVPKSNKGSLQPAKSSSRASGGPKMYEIADGVSSTRAVFSHTEESKGQRRADRAISAVPLSDRVKSSGEVALCTACFPLLPPSDWQSHLLSLLKSLLQRLVALMESWRKARRVVEKTPQRARRARSGIFALSRRA